MFLETGFTFNQIHSSEMGLMNVQLDSGMIEHFFGVTRNIVEEKVGNKFHLYKLDEEPLTFNLTFALDPSKGKWDYTKRLEIVQWLFTKTYKPFVSDLYPEVAFYCIPISSSRLFLAPSFGGYITIQFRCNAPYGYSYPPSEFTFDLSSNLGTTILNVPNLSNVCEYYEPEIEIELKGTSTVITIDNLSDPGRPFIFDNLTQSETLFINNESGRIISSLGANTYRLTNFNRNWLRLVQGNNELAITGSCVLKFRCQYPIAL